MDDNWIDYNYGLQGIARQAFLGRADEIIAKSNLHGGWEGWFQVEICAQAQRQLSGYGEDPSCERRAVTTDREVAVYQQPARQICDFTITSIPVGATRRAYDIVELKCMTQGKLGEFVANVRRDVAKIGGAVLKGEYMNSSRTTGCVLAVVVDEFLTGEPTRRMRKLGEELGIRWEPCRLTNDGRVIAWAWRREFV